MKTDYFNLIESKVNTEGILKKKISNILNNQQTGGGVLSKILDNQQKGGMIPVMLARSAAKSAAKHLAKEKKANEKKEKKEKKANEKKEKKEKKTNEKKEKKEKKTNEKEAKKANKEEAKKEKNEEKQKTKEEKEKTNEEAKQKSLEQMEKLNNIEPNSAGPSPSYPNKLQVFPTDPHVTKKLSEKFTTHIGEVKDKIDEVDTKIEQQLEYVKEEQRILDEKKEILDNRLEEEQEEDGERSWEMVQGIATTAKFVIDRFMSIVRWILLLIIKFLIAIQPFIWVLCAIICVFVLIMLIAWLVRGGKFKVTDSEGKDVTKDSVWEDGKESCGNNYGSSGTQSGWDWNACLKNPIMYPLQRTMNNVNSTLDIPDILNKLRVNNPINALLKNLKLLNNDNFKTERTPNTNQRDDSITFINYKLIDSNVANKHFSSPTTQDDYYSISLLKPKNIEWELPHLDYKDTDMDKLPESIKNYKDNNNPDDYSLNDTAKIIFPWKKSNNQWVLDCDTIFTNNEKTDLYKEGEEGYCQANVVNARIYS
jgi:chemotaxis protein histidine kinase CheA|tara:strand:- start:527 stop:2137 length:1611 start_codon:yes stop_codon:yes gene_type:complete